MRSGLPFVIAPYLIFVLAALAEIAGCFAFWAWLRNGASPLWLIPGAASLADAGVRRVILVVAPDADPIRTHRGIGYSLDAG